MLLKVIKSNLSESIVLYVRNLTLIEKPSTYNSSALLLFWSFNLAHSREHSLEQFSYLIQKIIEEEY